MKFYLIAGEDSGDLHTRNLVRALGPEFRFRGVGGDKMQDEGAELIAHIRDINFMGFWEVIKNLGTIRKLFRLVKEDIRHWKPDAVVLVDYPGFNMRMMPFLKKLGIPIYYYISPQVWAWKKGRVKKIKQYADRMLVILPFEQEFYQKEGIQVDFVGHPLLDEVPLQGPKSTPDRNPVIALLPGSRKQEISRMLPIMLEATSSFPSAKFVVAGAPSQPVSFYQPMIQAYPNVEIRMNQTYDLLESADYAMVTSGTATLETALFRVPQVVCYRGSWLSYHIGKRLVQVDYISLVNLILGKEAVKELIQGDFNVNRLTAELKALMNPKRYKRVQDDYEKLYQKLGETGASARAAHVLIEHFAKHSVSSLP
ncbi:MAG: lipid-A-disaccharide synthase [Bacteroidota bacterium]